MRLRFTGSSAFADDDDRESLSNAIGIIRRADFRESSRKSGARPDDLHPLDPRTQPRHQPHVTRRNTQFLGDELDQRRIRLALARRRAHPHLQYAPSVRQLLDALDGIAAAFWREPHGEDERAGLASPGRNGITHSPEQRAPEPEDELVEKYENDDEDH